MSYEKEAVSYCRVNFEAAYSKFKPKVILALGNIPLSYLTGYGGPGMTVSHLRGYVFKPRGDYSELLNLEGDLGNTVVLPTYHPSFIRRGATELYGVFARDIQRAVNIAKGIDNSYILDDPLMAVYRDELAYELKPTAEEAWAFYRRVQAAPEQVISYDLETKESPSLDEDARDEFSDTQIRQVQFTAWKGSGIAVPATEEFWPFIEAMMQLPNPKVGHNVYGFDNRVLRVVSEQRGLKLVPAGRIHDTMVMFRRWQPELPSNLQYAASFVQFYCAWKHLAGEHLPLYGILDTDAAWQIFAMLEKSMESKSMLQEYYTQIEDLHDLPAEVASAGLGISLDAAVKVQDDLAAQQQVIQLDLDRLYPLSEKTYFPEEGYKKAPKQVEQFLRLWDSERLGVLLGERTVLDGESQPAYILRITGMLERDFLGTVKDPYTRLPVKKPVVRWCKPIAVSPNSRQQILRYAKFKKHEVVKQKDEHGSLKESTTLDAIELMYGRTKDPFYRSVVEYRRLSESKRVAIELQQAAMGRQQVKSVFQINLDGTMGARNPGLPEWKEPACKIITAREGCHFVRWNWTGQWERLVLAHAGIAVTGDIYLLALERLNIPAVAMKGFLLGETDRAILEANRMTFGTAQKRIADMRARLNGVMPQLFKWHEEVRERAHRELNLTNRFGELRWFYEVKAPDGKGGWRSGEQSMMASRFLPESEAAGHVRVRLGQLRSAWKMDTWKMVGFGRDWIVFEVPTVEAMSHVRQHYKQMSEPLKELEELSLPLQIDVGTNWLEWQKLDLR